MNVTILKPIKIRSTGETFLPGQVMDLPEEKAREWEGKGLVRTSSPPGPLPEAPQTGLKTANPGQSDLVSWKSPIFGLLEAPVLSRDFESFSLIHPLSGEIVTLPNEWLASLDERSAILEHDAGIPRKEADDQAKREFFGLFRKGGKP